MHTHLHAQYDRERECWVVGVAPVFQEVYGGDEDGQKVWTGFLFDIADFLRWPGVHIEEYAVASYCNGCTPVPKLMMSGKFRGHPVMLHILLEPPPNTEPVEVLDTLTHQIREKEKVDGEDC